LKTHREERAYWLVATIVLIVQAVLMKFLLADSYAVSGDYWKEFVMNVGVALLIVGAIFSMIFLFAVERRAKGKTQ